MPIIVALVQAPGVFGDLLETVIERDPEFELGVRVGDETELADLHTEPRLDAVIVSTQNGSIPPIAGRLLDERACGIVVAIATDGKNASLESLREGPTPLRAVSPDQLLAAIRRALAEQVP